MLFLSRFLRQALFAAAASSVSSAACYADGIAATATYTSTQVSPGLYNYTLTLNNTGTTTIGTFWFAWVPGAGFLSAAPTAVGNPAGWTDTVTNSGAAIRWVTTTSLLAAGSSLSGFSFESAETPGQLLLNYTGTGAGAGDPVTTSFVYIGAPLADRGFQFVPQATAVAATPEPGTWALLLTGMAMLGLFYRGRLQSLPGR